MLKKLYVHVCINFKTLYLKNQKSFLNENFSESFYIHILYCTASLANLSSPTPRLANTGSRRLPDSPIRRVGDSRLTMRIVGESTKGKIKSLDLYVCLLLQASLVQLKHACAKKTVHFKFFSSVGYSAKKF